MNQANVLNPFSFHSEASLKNVPGSALITTSIIIISIIISSII